MGAVARWLPYSAFGKNYLHMLSQPGPIASLLGRQHHELLHAEEPAAAGLDACPPISGF
jgi:hypothetical protein